MTRHNQNLESVGRHAQHIEAEQQLGRYCSKRNPGSLQSKGEAIQCHEDLQTLVIQSAWQLKGSPNVLRK